MAGDLKNSMHRPHGIIIVTDVDGVTYQRDTVQCCHCSKVWVYRVGSGRLRGFCQKCGAMTCGDPGCDACLPKEKRLDLYEAGKLITP